MKPKNTKNCRVIESTPGAEVPAGEQARVEERVLRDQAPGHPGEQADDADGDGAQGQRVGPAPLGSLDGGEHDADERRARTAGRPRSRRGGVFSSREFGIRRTASHGDDEAQGRAEPEHGLPGPDLEQQPGGEQAEHRARAGDADPGADRLAALLLGEGAGDDRQGGRHDQGGADTHQPAQPDQRRGRGGQRREAGAGGEDGQAGDQDRLAAVAVSQCAGRQQQPGEHQGVGVDDPLELAHRGVGRGGHVGQRHVQGGDGGHHQGQGQQDDGEYPAALGGRIVGGHGRSFQEKVNGC